MLWETVRETKSQRPFSQEAGSLLHQWTQGKSFLKTLSPDLCQELG
jgi:hypothetical protein